jgi:hypothetical protein
MGNAIYPGLAHQALGMARELHQGKPWEQVRDNAWLKYKQLSKGIGSKQDFEDWADQQRRDGE